MVDLRGRDFLKLLDYNPEEISHLIDVAIDVQLFIRHLFKIIKRRIIYLIDI